PPPRGPITPEVTRGQQVFEKLQCAVCHMPEMHTMPQVFVVDPDSPAPKAQFIEVKGLENQPVRLYSDLLLHFMGPELADGIPPDGAGGGEWRTTPLWGLHLKKFFLHDGRTSSLQEAVLAHGGQGSEARDTYKKLPESEQQDLLSFLKSL